jgi:hypothetical protein
VADEISSRTELSNQHTFYDEATSGDKGSGSCKGAAGAKLSRVTIEVFVNFINNSRRMQVCEFKYIVSACFIILTYEHSS